MGRLKQLKIGVDALTEAKLAVRAGHRGVSVSEFVRDLILRELSNDHRVETLTPQLLEVALVTGIMVRAQVGRSLGEDEARKIQARAQEKAAEQLAALLNPDAEPTS